MTEAELKAKSDEKGAEHAGGALERLIELGHLSAGVGHHVINAFSAIVSNAELLRVSPQQVFVDPIVLAETIIKSAVQASTVARRLIDYSRPLTSIEPNRAAFEPHPVRLERIVSEAVDSLDRGAFPDLEIDAQLESTSPIKGHEVQLKSMLGRLIQNSIEALPAGRGKITISTCSDTLGWIVLELRDSGCGMEPATLERAVEPFFSTKPGHLGVGLSIANGIWRRHRGTISIQSAMGEGTRIRLFVEPNRQ
jgi:signal transduction histidine kinase